MGAGRWRLWKVITIKILNFRLNFCHHNYMKDSPSLLLQTGNRRGWEMDAGRWRLWKVITIKILNFRLNFCHHNYMKDSTSLLLQTGNRRGWEMGAGCWKMEDGRWKMEVMEGDNNQNHPFFPVNFCHHNYMKDSTSLLLQTGNRRGWEMGAGRWRLSKVITIKILNFRLNFYHHNYMKDSASLLLQTGNRRGWEMGAGRWRLWKVITIKILNFRLNFCHHN